MARKAIGIDIGGTGIKGALVNTKKGVLVGDRVRFETPAGGRPNDIARVVGELIAALDGANSNTQRSAFFGRKSSLVTSLSASAKPCQMPPGPVRVGPRRCCSRATPFWA